MNRVLAISVASFCILGICKNAFAIEETTVEAEYAVNSTFLVTVPDNIIFSNAQASVDKSIEASNVIINSGEELIISMKSANGKLANGASYIPYSFTLGENTTQIASTTNYELLRISSGNKNGSSEDITFTAGELDNVTLAGLHSDTLTFIVDIEGPQMSFEANLFDDGEPHQLTDARDAKQYWVTKFGDKIWMTQDLAYAPSGANWDDNGIVINNGNVYYNWSAAENACPKGWVIPSKTDYEDLISNLPDGSKATSAPFNATLMGYINYGYAWDAGADGHYWTSTDSETANNMYSVTVSKSGSLSLAPISTKSRGYSLRCVAE